MLFWTPFGLEGMLSKFDKQKIAAFRCQKNHILCECKQQHLEFEVSWVIMVFKLTYFEKIKLANPEKLHFST